MTAEERDEREAELAAYLSVLHAVKELCDRRAPHSVIEDTVTLSAGQLAERGIAFLTRLRDAELARDSARTAAFEDGRRAGLSQVYTMVQEAPRTWSAEKVLGEVVAAVKP